MSGNDYLEAVRKKNPKLFAQRDAKIQMKLSEFEEQLRHAFAAGFEHGKGIKESLLEKVFGTKG